MDLYDRMARLAPQAGQGHPYPPTLSECYREIAALRLALLDAHARIQTVDRWAAEDPEVIRARSRRNEALRRTRTDPLTAEAVFPR